MSGSSSDIWGQIFSNIGGASAVDTPPTPDFASAPPPPEDPNRLAKVMPMLDQAVSSLTNQATRAFVPPPQPGIPQNPPPQPGMPPGPPLQPGQSFPNMGAQPTPNPPIRGPLASLASPGFPAPNQPSPGLFDKVLMGVNDLGLPLLSWGAGKWEGSRLKGDADQVRTTNANQPIAQGEANTAKFFAKLSPDQKALLKQADPNRYNLLASGNLQNAMDSFDRNPNTYKGYQDLVSGLQDMGIHDPGAAMGIINRTRANSLVKKFVQGAGADLFTGQTPVTKEMVNRSFMRYLQGQPNVSPQVAMSAMKTVQGYGRNLMSTTDLQNTLDKQGNAAVGGFGPEVSSAVDDVMAGRRTFPEAQDAVNRLVDQLPGDPEVKNVVKSKLQNVMRAEYNNRIQQEHQNQMLSIAQRKQAQLQKAQNLAREKLDTTHAQAFVNVTASVGSLHKLLIKGIMMSEAMDRGYKYVIDHPEDPNRLAKVMPMLDQAVSSLTNQATRAFVFTKFPVYQSIEDRLKGLYLKAKTGGAGVALANLKEIVQYVHEASDLARKAVLEDGYARIDAYGNLSHMKPGDLKYGHQMIDALVTRPPDDVAPFDVTAPASVQNTTGRTVRPGQMSLDDYQKAVDKLKAGQP